MRYDLLTPTTPVITVPITAEVAPLIEAEVQRGTRDLMKKMFLAMHYGVTADKIGQMLGMEGLIRCGHTWTARRGSLGCPDCKVEITFD